MLEFFRSFSISQPSFWLGFITGILFLWLFLQIRPYFRPLWNSLITRFSNIRENLTAGVESRYRDEVIKYCQKQHIASSLFALDEIAIQPFFLAPPPSFDNNNRVDLISAAGYTIPYLPDWPELGSYLNAPTLSLAEALSVSNVAIIGHPGSGKTFALSHFASGLARYKFNDANLSDRLPVFVHAADLDLTNKKLIDPFDILINALSEQSSTLTHSSLFRVLRHKFNDGRVIFLLDGLDEFPLIDVDQVVNFIGTLIDKYPEIRIVTAASIEYFDGLINLGFQPLPIGSWNEYHRKHFIDKWSRLWEKYITPELPEEHIITNQELAKGWLIDENPSFTPLEFTLKIWSISTGDMLGPGASDAIEAYIRRLTENGSKSRLALESAAKYLLLSSKPTFDLKKIENSNSLLALSPSGVVISRANSQYSLVNPAVTGYLAASSIINGEALEELSNTIPWPLRSITELFIAALGEDISFLAETYLEKTDDPIQTYPLMVARWIRHTKQDCSWKISTLRYLADLLQREKYSLGLRSRVVAAIATSQAVGVTALFEKLLNSPDETSRLLAIFGSGLLRDKKLISTIETCLNDPSSSVRIASVLALHSFATDRTIDDLTTALVKGEEDVRRTAAEVLSSHPKLGRQILVESSQSDDLMVRRAAVYGLIQSKQSWAIELLNNLAIEDGQWVIRNACAHAIETIGKPSPYIPNKLPPDSENPYLIAIAGEYGIGLVPGKSADELVFRILKNGSEDQRFVAIERLSQHMDPRMIPVLYNILYGTSGELREKTFDLLWQMAASGIEMPPPTQYGLG
jgi:HEAT repeat protein